MKSSFLAPKSSVLLVFLLKNKSFNVLNEIGNWFNWKQNKLKKIFIRYFYCQTSSSHRICANSGDGFIFFLLFPFPLSLSLFHPRLCFSFAFTQFRLSTYLVFSADSKRLYTFNTWHNHDILISLQSSHFAVFFSSLTAMFGFLFFYILIFFSRPNNCIHLLFSKMDQKHWIKAL